MKVSKDVIKSFCKKYKKKIIAHGVFAMLLFLAVVWVFNDYAVYRNKTILKVTGIQTSSEYGDSEQSYNQEITGRIMNGPYKEQTAVAQNTYSDSGTFDEKYREGDELFVELSQNKDAGMTFSILEVKRDKYLAIVAALLLWLIVLAAGRKGVFAIISLCINIVLLTFALEMYTKGYNILSLFNYLVIIYTIICVLFMSGFSRKTLAAIISILSSLCITMIIFRTAYHYSDGVDFFLMDYLTSPLNLYELFMAEILIGGLGAIMDVAISIASAIDELVRKDAGITAKKLFESGRQIGYDIMGTMINILLFTFISGSIPFIILQLKNGFSIWNVVSMHLPFEIYRFLSGSIGILLTVPVSIGISILFLKKRRGRIHD